KHYGTDLEKIRSKALSESIANGDESIREIVRNAARQIGIAAGNLVNLLLPDTIILGGGLVEAMPELFVQTVRETSQKRAMKNFAEQYRVVAAQLGDEAGVLGAAAWVQHQVVEHSAPAPV
ncbi:MAG: ROK family protein, partial [Planctomycetales bacterium]|nr:ROK family protein [Planctomycetales bacterium]